MTTRKRKDYRALLLDDSRLVERPAPGKAPTAFRIWAAGPNPTDHGPTVFSPRSAECLIEQQATRGNLYSIDLDHLSLETNRPAEAGRAAGWHKLAVRPDENGAPELWAVDVEWCPDIREGLEMDPPKWRYFSPAYTTNAETGEVISYLNTALCINPATWSNTQLATRARKDRTVNEKELLLALKAMTGGEDDKAKQAAAMFAAMGGEERLAALEGEDKPAADAEGEDEEPESEKKPEADAQERPETPYGIAAPKGGKQAQDATVQLAARVAKLEAQVQRNAVKNLVEKHKDRFTPATRDWALAQPIEVVQSYVKAAPKLDMRAPATTQATRGDKQGEGAAPRLPKHEEERIDAVLGITSPRTGKPGLGEYDPKIGGRVINALRPSEYRAQKAAQNAAQRGEQKGA
jgi:hypothetical protein